MAGGSEQCITSRPKSGQIEQNLCAAKLGLLLNRTVTGGTRHFNLRLAWGIGQETILAPHVQALVHTHTYIYGNIPFTSSNIWDLTTNLVVERAIKLARKLHAHAIMYANKLVSKKRKKRKKDYACQVWPRALRKGYLKGRAPPHRPRGRGGTEVFTS
eukprot:295338-Pelagomonas_calceolata.AAC.1